MSELRYHLYNNGWNLTTRQFWHSILDTLMKQAQMWNLQKILWNLNEKLLSWFYLRSLRTEKVSLVLYIWCYDFLSMAVLCNRVNSKMSHIVWHTSMLRLNILKKWIVSRRIITWSFHPRQLPYDMVHIFPEYSETEIPV